MDRRWLGVVLMTGALVAAGCDNVVENATQPAEPAPTITETFTGTLTVSGAQTHMFNVAANGSVTVTLTEVTPDNSILVGLVLGIWNAVGGTCTSVIAGTARQGNAVSGNVTGTGTVCVRVHDVGTLTESLNYTLSVVHP